MKRKVLFLCTGNSCRSQMAEAIVNARLGDAWQAFSAGTRPTGYVHPLALRVLAEIGIQHEGRSKHAGEYRGVPFDLVVTVCEDAAENCPIWLGQGKRVHLGFPDPAKATGTEDEVMAAFRQVRDDIASSIEQGAINMEMTAASAAYFERVAGDWDALRADYFSEAVREAAIAHAYLRPEMTVADVGGGTGFLAAGLAPLVDRAYVLDGSAAMLDVAQRNLAGLDNVSFRQTDGCIIPLPDASLDAVFANMYLHHCPDPVAAIREMVRTLTPGGRLVLTDMDAHTQAWMRAEMADEWLGFDRGQIKAWLREADLVNVLVDCASQCCAASQTAPGDAATIGVFVATGSKRVTGAREVVQASYGAVAAGSASSDSSCCAPGTCCAPIAPITLTPSAPVASCCGPDVVANAMPEIAGAPGQQIFLWETGYSRDQLAAIPAEAAQISLGCGNPAALASLKPGEVVLDIGSGGGIDAFFAAGRVGSAGRVIGLDMTPAMIERARRSAADAGLVNVEFRLGQAEAMPVEDDVVDVLMSNCVINLCEDKGRVFEEAYRVLRAGGRLAISDMVTAGPLPLSVRGDAERWAGCVHGALPEGEYLDLVRAAGFADVSASRSLSGGVIEGVSIYSVSVSASKG